MVSQCVSCEFCYATFKGQLKGGAERADTFRQAPAKASSDFVCQKPNPQRGSTPDVKPLTGSLPRRRGFDFLRSSTARKHITSFDISHCGPDIPLSIRILQVWHCMNYASSVRCSAVCCRFVPTDEIRTRSTLRLYYEHLHSKVTIPTSQSGQKGTSMSDDLENEISAINSIYGDGTFVLSNDESAHDLSSTAAIYCISIPDQDVSLRVQCPPSYPQDQPLSFIGVIAVGESVPKGYGQHVLALAQDIVGEVYTPGYVCMFDVLETISQRLADGDNDNDDDGEGRGVEEDRKDEHPKDASAQTEIGPPSQISKQANTNSNAPIDQPTSSMSSLAFPPVEWHTSTPTTVKKSLFIAQATRITSPSHATHAIATLLASDKRLEKATHNISAYRIPITFGVSPPITATLGKIEKSTLGNGSGKNRDGAQDAERRMIVRYEEDFNDDGESAAGGRLLKLLQLMDIPYVSSSSSATRSSHSQGRTRGGEAGGGGAGVSPSPLGVLVVVSRWFGGVKLGPARFAMICGVAREAVEEMLEAE